MGQPARLALARVGVQWGNERHSCAISFPFVRLAWTKPRAWHTHNEFLNHPGVALSQVLHNQTLNPKAFMIRWAGSIGEIGEIRAIGGLFKLPRFPFFLR